MPRPCAVNPYAAQQDFFMLKHAAAGVLLGCQCAQICRTSSSRSMTLLLSSSSISPAASSSAMMLQQTAAERSARPQSIEFKEYASQTLKQTE
jgi:hypothetical protein